MPSRGTNGSSVAPTVDAGSGRHGGRPYELRCTVHEGNHYGQPYRILVAGRLIIVAD